MVINTILGTITALLFILILVCAIYQRYRIWDDARFWSQWEQNPRNFPYMFRGREQWKCRNTSVTLLVLCKNALGKWCCLLNKRGQGTPDVSERGKWNMVGGYIEYETGEETAQREAHEECGISIPLESIIQDHTDTEVHENLANIVIRHHAILDGTIDDYEVSKKYMEKDEVEDIMWLPLDELSQHTFAFGQNHVIKRLVTKYLPTIAQTVEAWNV